MCEQWNISFRQAADTFRSTNSSTFVNNTPDISYTASGSAVADGRPSSDEELCLSLPFACHEIFCKVTPLLKSPSLVKSVCTILSHIVPFLKLYLDSLTVPLPKEEALLDYEKYALFCVGTIAEAISYYRNEAFDMEDFQMDMIQQLIFSQMIDLVSLFAPSVVVFR